VIVQVPIAVNVTVVPAIVQGELPEEYVTVAPLFVVAMALNVLPKVAFAVWFGGAGVVEPLVNVIVGVSPTTVMVRVDEPAP
jgi:hypothetical protein